LKQELLEANSIIVFGVFFSGEAAEKHTNPLVVEMILIMKGIETWNYY
jgi:hypothetical protein